METSIDIVNSSLLAWVASAKAGEVDEPVERLEYLVFAADDTDQQLCFNAAELIALIKRNPVQQDRLARDGRYLEGVDLAQEICRPG